MVNIMMAGPWITDHEKQTIAEMMESGWDNYKYVEEFEPAFAKWHDRKYALMTPCGTHAIHLLLLALDIKEGDEVIVPECTWTGSVAPVTYCGAVPVFADIDERNWCLSPESVERNISDKTKAIIVVDLYGNMPDMKALKEIADRHEIYLIEDAAEALGSKLNKIRAGKFGIGGVHSFHRTKTMTTGEGGALLLDDDKLYERAKFLRDHGRSSTIPYFTIEATPKYMPSNMQGAMAVSQFERIDELVEKKRYFLHEYKRKLAGVGGIQFNVESDSIYNGAWATTIVIDRLYHISKNMLIEKLSRLAVPARPFFYPLSSLPAYEHYKTGSQEDNPVAYNVADRGITLASHYNLTDNQISHICNGIREALKDLNL